MVLWHFICIFTGDLEPSLHTNIVFGKNPKEPNEFVLRFCKANAGVFWMVCWTRIGYLATEHENRWLRRCPNWNTICWFRVEKIHFRKRHSYSGTIDCRRRLSSLRSFYSRGLSSDSKSICIRARDSESILYDETSPSSIYGKVNQLLDIKYRFRDQRIRTKIDTGSPRDCHSWVLNSKL